MYLCCSIYNIIQNKPKSLLVDAIFAKDPICNNFIHQRICKFSEKKHLAIKEQILNLVEKIPFIHLFSLQLRSPFSCDIKLMLLQLKYIVNSF